MRIRIISWCSKQQQTSNQTTNISSEAFLNLIACKRFIPIGARAAALGWGQVCNYLWENKPPSLYKLSFNSNCFAWSLCLDDVINKLLKRLLVSFKPIVNSLGLMDHFNCNALGENWIFSLRIGTDTWLNLNENNFAVLSSWPRWASPGRPWLRLWMIHYKLWVRIKIFWYFGSMAGSMNTEQNCQLSPWFIAWPWPATSSQGGKLWHGVLATFTCQQREGNNKRRVWLDDP